MAATFPPLRIAVEGCGHGELNAIYTSIEASCSAKGWDGIDLLIICGDFQACRNNHDMNWMAVPRKYQHIRDFHEYYSGKRTAPYLTLFIGGNHEASNHLQELYYGGWAAPNIYYMGAANVVKVGGVRIAGISGIWKGYDYRKPHFQLSSLDGDGVRQIYHTREIDVRKLLQLRSQVDIGLSHDWPNRIETDGDVNWLLSRKKHFRDDVRAGKLGSPAARYVFDHLRPPFWFSAHLHVKYSAIVHHRTDARGSNQAETPQDNPDEIPLDDNAMMDQPDGANPDELSLDEDGDGNNGGDPAQSTSRDGGDVGRDQKRRAISNTVTRFLALDKCLAQKNFLQLIEIARPSVDDSAAGAPAKQFEYDPEWLAITRVFANAVKHVDMRRTGNTHGPADPGHAYYQPLIDKEIQWVDDNVVKMDKLKIPCDFQRHAPVYDPKQKYNDPNDRPPLQPNQHTERFCSMLQIPSPL